MSRKSTGTTKYDGDKEYCSSSDRSSDTERKKSDLCASLSFEKEPSNGPSGDYSTPRKIMTPENLETIPETNSSSNCSLDNEELYGTDDAFGRNLEYLKEKLNLLNVSGFTPESRGYLSIRETCLDLDLSNRDKQVPSPELRESNGNLDSYRVPLKKACLREKSPRSISKICLSSTPNNLDLASLVRSNLKAINDFKLNLLPPLKTGKVSPLPSVQTERSSTSSDLYYTVPAKKPCFRNESPKIQERLEFPVTTPSDFSRTIGTQFEGLSDYFGSGSTSCRSSELCSDCNRTNRSEPFKFVQFPELKLDLPRNVSSTNNSSDKLNPAAQNVQIGTRKVQNSNINSFEGTISNLSSSDGSITCRTAPARLVSSAASVSVNLPSTVDDFSASNANRTPLEPKIVVLEKVSSKKMKKPSRKCSVVPICVELECSSVHSEKLKQETPEIEEQLQKETCNIEESFPKETSKKEDLLETTSEIIPTRESSKGESDSSENERKLLIKYFEDTPELSSNPVSSPPAMVSTCASNSSSYARAYSSPSSTFSTVQNKKNSLRIVYGKRQELKRRSDVLYEDFRRQTKPSVFNPHLQSSLDVPKIFGFANEACLFPAITKITTLLGKFSLKPGRTSGTEDVLAKAEIFDETGTNFKQEVQNSNHFTRTIPKSQSNAQNSVRSFEVGGTSKGVKNRKVQSTQMTFYSVNSFEDLVGSSTIERSELINEIRDGIEEENQRHWNCGCLNVLFPRRKTRFFT